MSGPKKHHYLPEWYLSRWKREFLGEELLWEFTRVGPQNKLQAKYRHPGATGYAQNLYSMPNLPSSEATVIETELLQQIDDRGAKAVLKAEAGEQGSNADKAGLVQFLVSLLHRSPERLAWIESEITRRLKETPLFAQEPSETFRSAALNVFVDMIQSGMVIERLMEMSTFVLSVGENAFDLLTGDTPLMVSNGIGQPDGFVILPTGPRTLIMLAENKALAAHLASHPPKVLSKAMNDAIVAQAKNYVFGPDKKPMTFIDKRLNRPAMHKHTIDPITGLVKWAI